MADARRIALLTIAGSVVALVLAAAAIAFGFYALKEKRWADQQNVVAQEQSARAENALKDAQAQRDVAEAATKEAQSQRDAAEAAKKDTQNQRDVADTARKEAQAQRDTGEAAKKEAQAQSARTQLAIATATKTANTLVFDLAEKLRDVTGVPAEVIKAILDLALKLQDERIGAGESDPDLRRSEAAALNEAVDPYLTVGDTSGASAAALKSRDIIGQRVASPVSQFSDTLCSAHLKTRRYRIGLWGGSWGTSFPSPSS